MSLLSVRVACLALVASTLTAYANDDPPLKITRSELVAFDNLPLPEAPRPLSSMRIGLAIMKGTGWDTGHVLDAVKTAASMLRQCGIQIVSAEVTEFDGPRRFRAVYTPVSRELAGKLALLKPTLFFVADTLNRPAFDAEAVGRGNSRTRPEMANTVWITNGTRDLPNVIAHELAHVLADSGEHSSEPRNLMREETRPGDVQLTPAQCSEINRNGTSTGLLQPVM